MPRRRKVTPQSTAHIHFELLGEEQQTAFRMLLDVTPLGDVFDEAAKDGYEEAGRGLLLWVSSDGTVAALRPPVYITSDEWRANPLLINTPHEDLLRAIETYNPRTSYIVLLSSAKDKDLHIGLYAWWTRKYAFKPLLN